MKKIVILLLSLILILTGCRSISDTVSRTRPETYELTATYTVEKSPAIPSQDYKFELVPGENIYDSTVICGEDVPVGEYTINFSSNYYVNTVVMDYQEVGTGAATVEGDTLKKGEVFYCEQGYEVDVFNDGGTLTLTSVAKPAVEETKDITEKVVYKYDGDKDGDNMDDNLVFNEDDYIAICYSDDVEIPCEDLHSSTLYEDTVALFNSAQFALIDSL